MWGQVVAARSWRRTFWFLAGHKITHSIHSTTDLCVKYEACPERKIHHVWADKENFYAYYGNTAVDLDPLPVSRAHLTVVEPALFEWDVFEMAAPIQIPAKCEVRSVIRFLNVKGERPVEIHKQIVAVYGNFRNRQMWRRKKHLAGKKFVDDDEVQEEVMT